MKSHTLLSVFLLLMIPGFADMPGNTPREAVHVFVRLGDLQGYTIYANGPYANYGEDNLVKDSADILLNGGYGEPPCVTFFGRDVKGRYTDSLFICNEEQGNVAISISVVNGRLQTSEVEAPVREDVAPLVEENTGDSGERPDTPIRALVLMALASVFLLIAWYVFTGRKREAL